MGIITKVVTITPADAVLWLEGNIHNRKLRESRVRLYARDIKGGKWRLTHQGIAFDESGKLSDGQHRLWAIVEADTPATMMVSWGVPSTSLMVIDDHLQRNVVDAIGLSTDSKISFQTAALASLLVHGFGGGRPSHIQVSDGLEKFHLAIEFCKNAFHPNVRTLCQSAVQAAVARAYYSVDTNLLSLFVKCLITGVRPDSVSEIRHNATMLLRNYLQFRVDISRRRKLRRDIYLRVERSLYAFIHEQAISKLFPAKGELFPFDGVMSEEDKWDEFGKHVTDSILYTTSRKRQSIRESRIS